MPTFNWQGHRGCRGLMPENTIAAFNHALSFERITTLEMDVVISADSQVVVSHEPWMSEEICSLSAYQKGEYSHAFLGLPQVAGQDEEAYGLDSVLAISRLTLAEIQRIDCGTKPHPRFPEQQKLPARKPSLTQLFKALPEPTAERPYDLNIELKYTPEWEAAGLVPDVPTFCRLVLAAIAPFRTREQQVSLQCFYPPLLAELRRQDAKVPLVYLDEFPEQGKLENKFSTIELVPEVYSPYWKGLRPAEVQKAHELGSLVIPWTVNSTGQMLRLMEVGVDGIITDYPDRIPE